MVKVRIGDRDEYWQSLRDYPIEGPLKEFLGVTSIDTLFSDIGAETVLFLGPTKAGKTTSIRALTNSLGGIRFEEVSETGRTLVERAYIFTYSHYFEGRLGLLALRSNAGHDPKETVEHVTAQKVIPYYLDSFSGRVIYVTDTLDNLDIFNPIKASLDELAQDRFAWPIEKVGLMLTKRDKSRDKGYKRSEVKHLERFLPEGASFFGVTAVDNRPESMDIQNIDVGNIDLLLLQLRISNTSLVYFGNEPIPAYLEGKVVSYQEIREDLANPLSVSRW